MQAVRGDEVAGGEPGRGDVVDALAHLVDALRQDAYAELRGPFGERGLEVRAAGAEARTGPEEPLGPQAARAVDVADAAERLPRHGHAQRVEAAYRPGHEALPAGLVDGGGPRFRDHDLQAGEGAVDGGREPGRTTAGDQQVDHEGAPADGTEAGACSRRRPSGRRPRSRSARAAVPG